MVQRFHKRESSSLGIKLMVYS